MPRICGANGCVFIPNIPAASPANSANTVLGYDVQGNPVYPGQNDRAIVSQSPGSVPSNPNDPTGRYYKPYPGPYQSHLPLEQRTDLVNGMPPESITFTRGVNERVPQDMRPYTAQIPQGADPAQFSDQFNRQVHPETFADKISGELENLGPRTLLGPLGRPIYDNWDQIKQGLAGGQDGGNGMAGRYTFQPRFPGQLQSQYETLYGNAINRLNQRFGPGAESGINPILNQARTEFQTRTIPGIAEAFTALPGAGGQRSSAFQGSLGAAGAGLNENLAALQGQYDLEQQSQMMRLLGMSPYENVYEGGTPGAQGQGNSGIFPALLEAGVAGGLGYLTGGPAGAAAGAGGSLFNRWKSTRNASPTAQPPIIPQQQGGFNQLAPEQQSLLNNISRNAAPGNNLTPQQVQQIQSITGGVNAGEDFARTFRQPQPQRLTFPQTPQQQARFAGFNRAGVL